MHHIWNSIHFSSIQASHQLLIPHVMKLRLLQWKLNKYASYLEVMIELPGRKHKLKVGSSRLLKLAEHWGCLKRNWNDLRKCGVIYKIITWPLNLPTLSEVNYAILEPVMKHCFITLKVLQLFVLAESGGLSPRKISKF